jgi:predicted dehydrogenase
MKKIINVGIIGLGVGKKHWETYEKDSSCKVVAIADFDKKKLNKYKKKFSRIKFVTDANKILKDKLIDLISIASYDNYHYDHIIKSIKNEKHIFIEKPLCLNYSEYFKIKKALLKKPKIKISSNLVLRNSPQFLKLKKKIDKKNLGDIYYMSGEYNYGRLQKITKGWRSKIPFYSVMHGGGLHIIDLMLWLIEKKVKKVIALGNNIMTKKTKFRFNDLVSSLIEFENGITANVTANFASVTDHHHTLSVYGKKGTFIQKYKDVTLRKSRNKNEKKIIIKHQYLNKNKSFILKSFIKSIIYNKKPVVTKDDILRTMAVSLAVEKSVKSKKWEKVIY